MKTALKIILILVTSLRATAQDLTASEWLEKAKQTSDPTQQILLFSKALKLDENLTAAYYGRGLARFKKELVEEAITDFDIALSLDPKPEYYGSRGEAYYALTKYQDAISDFTVAYKAKPSDTKILTLRAQAFLEMQNYTSARTDFETILSKSPADATALAGKGLILLHQGQLEDAIRYIDDAIKYDPKNLIAWVHKGLYFEKKKDYTAALKQYDQTLAVKKTFEPALNGKKRVMREIASANNPTQKEIPSPSVVPASVYANFPQLSNFKKKYALIIGNSNYKYYSALQGFPVNDANDINHKLKEEFGFESIVVTNAGYETFTKSLVEFYRKIENADVVLIFYAGHGVEFNGLNYLIPTDKKDIDAENADYESINVQKIIKSIQQKNVNYTVMVIDACRSSRGMMQKTEKIMAPDNARNYFIAYATSSGEVAQNGNKHNGIYTQELLKCIKKGVRIDDIFMNTRAQVMKVTGNTQAPENTVGLTAPFVF